MLGADRPTMRLESCCSFGVLRTRLQRGKAKSFMRRASEKSKEAGTRTRILDAAETLFSEQGFAPVTTRQIAAAAEVSLSALPYHFGSKREILFQVLDRRLGKIQTERAKRLREIEDLEPGKRDSIRQLLEALLVPTFEMAQKHRAFTKLLGSVSIDPNPEVRSVMNEVFARYPTGLPDAFRKSLPHLDDEAFYWRYYCVFGAMVYIESDTGRMDIMSGGKLDFTRPLDNIEHILSFFMSGFDGVVVDGSGEK